MHYPSHFILDLGIGTPDCCSSRVFFFGYAWLRLHLILLLIYFLFHYQYSDEKMKN
nr:MAG TPA: hypothetical protein [Caudoviricetes sp.]